MLTKSQVLRYLKDKLKGAKVLDQVSFTKSAWAKNQKKIIDQLAAYGWLDKKLIVRSSSFNEDTNLTSQAGHYDSVLGVQGVQEVSQGVCKVIASYPEDGLDHEVFIQPFLENVKVSGVAFTKDPSTGAPYLRINYDDQSGTTDSITSGTMKNGKSFYHHRRHQKKPKGFLDKVIALCFEVEAHLNQCPVDIEFAIDQNDTLYLFQARPLVQYRFGPSIDEKAHYELLKNIEGCLENWMQPHPYLLGDQAIYGVMPDWNPAEIIGVYPKPLAASIYREVVTNSIWAYQRDNYGYRELRSFPLLVELEGLPYIDVRVSFNSFIPKSLDTNIAAKLVNYYLDKLRQNPAFHDKVEFEIVYSCYTFNTPEKIIELKSHGFEETEIKTIIKALSDLTAAIICSREGLWKKDLARVQTLEQKFHTIVNSAQNPYAKIFWLIEDCKRYGTLPFAGLARAGFIAVEFLKSFVSEGIFTSQDYDAFMGALNTVSSSLAEDSSTLSREEFLKKYGHLRPGTYDITSKTYAQDFDAYFASNAPGVCKATRETRQDFRLSVSQLNALDQALQEHGFSINALELLNFIKGAIEAREYAKFIFTKSISKVLDLYRDICAELAIPEEDACFTHIGALLSLNSVATDHKSILEASIKRRKERFELTKQVSLPALITAPGEVFSFHELPFTPNFITQKQVRAQVVALSNQGSCPIEGKIVLIENADPGFDWLFSHNIKGLITKYGGANSHMAIRSGELGIPSIIGAGTLYDKIQDGRYVNINCLEKKIEFA